MSRIKRIVEGVGIRCIAFGVKLTSWAGAFPEPEPESEDGPDVDDDGRTYPVELDDEAIGMLIDGRAERVVPREEVEDEPLLEGALQHRKARRRP